MLQYDVELTLGIFSGRYCCKKTVDAKFGRRAGIITLNSSIRVPICWVPNTLAVIPSSDPPKLPIPSMSVRYEEGQAVNLLSDFGMEDELSAPATGDQLDPDYP